MILKNNITHGKDERFTSFKVLPPLSMKPDTQKPSDREVLMGFAVKESNRTIFILKSCKWENLFQDHLTH